MQTVLLESLSNCSSHQCARVGAEVSMGHSLGSGLAVVLEAQTQHRIPRCGRVLQPKA